MPQSMNRAGLYLALALAGCGDPAEQCRKDIEGLKGELVGVVGAGHKAAVDPLVIAHTDLDIAEMALAAGNTRSCVENVKAARKLMAENK